MGYMVHHTIVVSCWDSKLLRKTHRKAKEIFKDTEHHISAITPMAVNAERSYFIAPDGSKAGWPTSIIGWEARKKFILYLKELKPYPPGWVLVQFADDSLNTLVIDSSNHYDSDKKYFGDWGSKAPKPSNHRD